ALGKQLPREYQILESRGRKREEIKKMSEQDFLETYWDARVFGSTFLEKDMPEHFIRTGSVQFGPGISIAPIEIERSTWTNKAGVEGDKDRGMAPLAWRVVRH